MREFATERQVELEVELPPGEYVVLPRTSGCGLIRPKSAKKESMNLIDPRTKELTHIAELTIKDIFRRLDKIELNNIISE